MRAQPARSFKVGADSARSKYDKTMRAQLARSTSNR
eukprot:IDg7644t1